jgi:hypothetical protein
MFSWASETFAKLSETVAPPPTDGASRFVYCCQRGDEEGAIAAVGEIPGAGCIVNVPKGQVPLHLACLHSMAKLIRVLLSQPGASLDVLDAAGNTPLHCACMSNSPSAALAVVKMLIQECGCGMTVTCKNGSGQTPYDVAVLNAVRQYLLPLQLQQETQQALDNGGIGLIPGADMGGLKIDRSHLPPPPMGGPGNLGGPPASPYVTTPMRGGPMSGGPSPGSGGGSYPEYSPGPSSGAGGGGGYQNNGQQPYGGAAPMTPGVPAQGAYNNGPAYGGAAPMTPQAPAQGASPMPHAMHRSQSAPDGQQQPPAQTSAQPLPQAPSSGNSSQHAYSRNGSSSAAFYQPKAGESRNFVRPDGFHSSSSDKTLQQKYGHSSTANGAAMPPPPSSSGSSYSNGGGPGGQPGQVQSSPGSLNNPYSGGLSALGGVNRSARNRYPVPGHQMQQQPPQQQQQQPAGGGYSGHSYGPPGANMGMGQMGMPPAPTNFNTFNPAAAQQQQGQHQPAATAGYAPPAAATQQGQQPVYNQAAAAAAPPASPGQGYGYAPPAAAAASPAAPGGYGFNTPSPGAPNMNPYNSVGASQGAASPVAPSPSSLSNFPPPPVPYHLQNLPAATFAAPPAATVVEQPPMEASPPPAVQPYSSPARSQPIAASPRSAEQVFGAKPQLVPTPTKEMPQPEPAAATFAAPPTATFAAPPAETFAAPPAETFAAPPAETFAAPPAETFVAPPAATMEAAPPMELSPAQSFPRSQPVPSPRSAEQVFGAKPTAVSSPSETQQPEPTTPAPASGNWQPLQRRNTEDSAASASALFSKPPTATPTRVETETEGVYSSPPRQSPHSLQRTSSTEEASDVFSKRPNEVAEASDVFATSSPQVATATENANSLATAESPAKQANGETSASAASPQATDAFTKPVEAADAFATAPPQAQVEPETVPQVHDATASLMNGTSAVAPQATDVFSKPQERAAADAFATAPPQAQTDQETSSPAQEESCESVPGPELKSEVTEPPTGAVEEDEEDMMADVPLSPYRIQEEEAHAEDTMAPAQPSIASDTSLFASIGMPPPPFTKKYTR